MPSMPSTKPSSFPLISGTANSIFPALRVYLRRPPISAPTPARRWTTASCRSRERSRSETRRDRARLPARAARLRNFFAELDGGIHGVNADPLVGGAEHLEDDRIP